VKAELREARISTERERCLEGNLETISTQGGIRSTGACCRTTSTLARSEVAVGIHQQRMAEGGRRRNCWRRQVYFIRTNLSCDGDGGGIASSVAHTPRGQYFRAGPGRPPACFTYSLRPKKNYVLGFKICPKRMTFA
jgi:hypothetical protein